MDKMEYIDDNIKSIGLDIGQIFTGMLLQKEDISLNNFIIADQNELETD